MSRRERLTPKSLGYEEVAVIQYRRRRTRVLRRLYSIVREVEEADPNFSVRMEIMVPHPTFENPNPCVFVLLQRATQKMWFRLKSWEDVQALFGLNEQDLAGIAKALEKAEEIACELREAREIAELALLQRSRDIYAEMQRE